MTSFCRFCVVLHLLRLAYPRLPSYRYPSRYFEDKALNPSKVMFLPFVFLSRLTTYMHTNHICTVIYHAALSVFDWVVSSKQSLIKELIWMR